MDTNTESPDEFIAMQVAEFVRDNMFELNKHPFDYQDHYDYIYELYMKWVKEYLENIES